MDALSDLLRGHDVAPLAQHRAIGDWLEATRVALASLDGRHVLREGPYGPAIDVHGHRRYRAQRRRRLARRQTPAFDPDTYKHRNIIEHCFNRLKQRRDLATRFAKRATIYQASTIIIAIMICLN